MEQQSILVDSARMENFSKISEKDANLVKLSQIFKIFFLEIYFLDVDPGISRISGKWFTVQIL